MKLRSISLYVILILSLPQCFLGQPSLKNHHKLLLVSFDGLKWSYYDRAKELPGFKFLSENGVRAKYVKPAFPSHTSPCHMTMATGLYPESHGVVHNFCYDQHKNKIQDDYVQTLAVNDWWDNGQEPIWITAVNQGLKSGGYLFPGSNATIGGKSATRSILQTNIPLLGEVDWKAPIDDVMTWFTDDDFDFTALYFGQPDNYTHFFGPNTRRVDDLVLPLIDQTIQYLFQKVKEYHLTNELNIIITSDHGMLEVNTSTRAEDTISLIKYIDPSWVTFLLGYGPLGLVEPVPKYKTAVYKGLKAGSDKMDVYYKEDIPERLHYKNNDRVTSIVVMAKHGYTVYDKFPGFHSLMGNHGYDNDFEDMRASYFSIGPSFKKGKIIEGFESIHIYPLMSYLLGLAQSPNNGTLDVLFPTLVESSDRLEL